MAASPPEVHILVSNPRQQELQSAADVKSLHPEPLVSLRDMLSHLPGVLAIALGLMYGTGFLIVSTFLGSFGIPGGEFLRLEYVQVGFYFLLFYGSVTALIVNLSRDLILRRSQTDACQIGTPLRPPANPLLLVIWIEYLLAIFLPVGFAEPQVTGRGSLPYIALLTLLCFLAVPTMYSFDRKYRRSNPQFGAFANLVYLLIALASGWLAWHAIFPLKEKLQEMLWPVFRVEIMCIFLIFAGALGWLIYRTLFARTEYTPQQHKKYMASRLALGVPIYYLCVLTFAYGIYPFMSVSKGGAYYKDAGFVRLTFRENVGRTRTLEFPERAGASRGGAERTRLNSSPDTPVEKRLLPLDLMDSDGRTKPLVLIEQDSDAVSVADPADPTNPPADHPGLGGVRCWTDYLCRPTVYQVQVLDLASIERIPPQREHAP